MPLGVTGPTTEALLIAPVVRLIVPRELAGKPVAGQTVTGILFSYLATYPNGPQL